MNLELRDKVFIITGGARGIGRGISQTLADEDAIPVMVSRSKDAGEAYVAELESEGKKAAHITRELSDAAGCKEIVDQVINEFGRIDGLVNNAGANDAISLEHGNPDDYLASLTKNLHHYYYLAHYALPELKRSQGSILNVASKVALSGQGGTTAYAAAKGAQLAFTREWAVELLKYKIRVNAIIPAEVYTPLYARWLDTFDDPEAKRRDIEKNIPFGQRMTTIEEMGYQAAFVLSNKVAGHITGQFLSVDGGYLHLDRALAKAD